MIKRLLDNWAQILIKLTVKRHIRREFNKIFESCWKHITNSQERGKEKKRPSWTFNKKIMDELAENYYSIACHHPPKFIVAHKELNQIVSMAVGERKVTAKDDNGKTIWVAEGIPETRTIDILSVKTSDNQCNTCISEEI